MKATNLAASASSSTGGLRDIKPPLVIPNGWLWVIWIAIALLVIAAAVALWYYLRNRRSRVVVVPEIPAHVRARRKLEQALALLAQPREFCILVSDTIRVYLEERFDFRAPERTTEEFLHELRATNLLLQPQKDSLGEFLQRCDLVKFAKYEPGEPELRDLLGAALKLVDETEPRPAPASAEAQPPAVEQASPISTR